MKIPRLYQKIVPVCMYIHVHAYRCKVRVCLIATGVCMKKRRKKERNYIRAKSKHPHSLFFSALVWTSKTLGTILQCNSKGFCLYAFCLISLWLSQSCSHTLRTGSHFEPSHPYIESTTVHVLSNKGQIPKALVQPVVYVQL